MTFSVFLSTTWPGVARAERSGGTWSVRPKVLALDARCLTAASDGSVILAGTQGDGVRRSEDGGWTWTESGLEGAVVKSIAFSGADPTVAYAGTKPPAIFASRDSGRTWQELEGFAARRRWWWRQPAERPTTPYVQSIAVSPTDPAIVLAGIEAGATLRSTDGGRNWAGHLRGALRDCHMLAFHSKQDVVYEAGGAIGLGKPGCAISRDAGATWEREAAGLNLKYGWAVVGDAGDPETWYVSVASGPTKAHRDGQAEAFVYRRDPRRWTRLSGGLPQPARYMPYALLCDEPDHVYAGLASGEIWHSSTRGASWQRLDVEMPHIWRTLIGI